MARSGKRYRESAALIEENRSYQPLEAISLVKQAATAKFDETVELHLRTGSDPRHADQMIRGVANLPHGVGKPIRVVVFTQGEAVATAQEAGADFVGSDDLIKRVQEDGWTDFDVSIATPDMMGRVGTSWTHSGQKRPDAQPEDGNGGTTPGHTQGCRRGQEGQGRVPLGQDCDHPRANRVCQLPGAAATG